MFKIGEFSKLTQVTVRMLRYYDEMGLLKPAKIDPWTGYRLYSTEQIPVLNKIIYLRDSGFQVAEIAAALENNDKAFLQELFNKKQAEIEENIKIEQEKLSKIDLAKHALFEDKNDLHYQISIKSIPSYFVLSLRKVIPDYYAEGELWQELSAFARQQNLELSSDTFSIYHDEDYKETDVDVEICVPVKKAGESFGNFTFRHTEAVPIMASTMVSGDFSNIAEAYRSFADWLTKNSHYKMGIQSRQIVHRGPWNEKNPKNYLTELQIPLTEFSA